MADDEAGPEPGDGDDGVYERIEYCYNRSGQVVRMTDPNGTIHDYDFNQLGQLLHDRVTTLAAHINGAVRRISLGYNKRGQMETASSHSSALVGHGVLLNQVKRDYNGFGQMVADWQEHEGAVTGSSPVVGYEFGGNAVSNASRLVGMVYPNGRRLDYGYGASNGVDDHLSRLQSIEEDEETLVNYHFSGLARYLRIVYPEPGVELTYLTAPGEPDGGSGDPYGGYDRFSRVQEMRWIKTATGEVVDCWQWGFDRASNRTWRKNLDIASGQDEAYGYDGLYQVIRDAVGTLNTNRTGVGGTPRVEEDFAYDPVGNWLGYRKDEDGDTVLDQTRSNNRDNQLVQIDGSSDLLEYDKSGNALKVPPGAGGDWGQCFQPVWDAWNRLVEVKDEEGDPIASYGYDGLTRRITRTAGITTTHIFYSDQWKPLEEREGTATDPVRQYVWGARPGHRDELILCDQDTDASGTFDERLYATMDYYNSTAILDTSGAVVERYAYSAFGIRRIMAPDFTPRAESDYDWEFAYKGQFRDTETGWYNYGYRFYVPKLGRWINRDPINELGGRHLYQYVYNNSPQYNDSFGAEPHNRYSTMADAVQAAANDVYQRTHGKNGTGLESGAVIYQNMDNSFSYTDLRDGYEDTDRNSPAINMELNNIPTGTRRVGDIHSHIYSDGPSDNDINTAWSDPRGRPRYVVTKDGKIIEYNPKRMPNVLKDDERRIKEVGKCDTSERSVE